jgi:hypothetical protein
VPKLTIGTSSSHLQMKDESLRSDDNFMVSNLLVFSTLYNRANNQFDSFLHIEQQWRCKNLEWFATSLVQDCSHYEAHFPNKVIRIFYFAVACDDKIDMRNL